MSNFNSLCDQFAKILNGKSMIKKGVCSVTLNRNLKVMVQGKLSNSITPVEVLFDSLDENGNALNLAEVALLQEEIPMFMQSIVQQGLIVSALHNHWLFTNPAVLYLHIQSVEPPLNFATKMKHSLSYLKSQPIAE